MVHSTWGDWFVSEEIEGTDPDGVSIWYLGCNGFVVRSVEATIYVDPYFGAGNPPGLIRMIPVPMDPADATECDAVFVTHEHIDHMHPPSFRPMVESLGATVTAPSTSFEAPEHEGEVGIASDNRNVVSAGDSTDVGDLTVHVRGANDPDAVEPVSYVIEHDAGTMFHAGDSRPAEAFDAIGNEFDLDLGVLAFGSRGYVAHPDFDSPERVDWYMNENQVVEAADDLELTRLLPSHWDMWNHVGADPKALFEHARSHRYPEIIEPVSIGDRVDLGSSGIVPPNSLDG